MTLQIARNTFDFSSPLDPKNVCSPKSISGRLNACSWRFQVGVHAFFLEIYQTVKNAKVHFFQTISRVKTPSAAQLSPLLFFTPHLLWSWPDFTCVYLSSPRVSVYARGVEVHSCTSNITTHAPLELKDFVSIPAPTGFLHFFFFLLYSSLFCISFIFGFSLLLSGTSFWFYLLTRAFRTKNSNLWVVRRHHDVYETLEGCLIHHKVS